MTAQNATSDEMDTIGYAISFRIGAEALAPSVTVDGSKNEKNLVLSFYLLVGFSVENALKSVLAFTRTDQSLRWAHSHNLSKMLRMCRDARFIVAPEVATFVDTIASHPVRELGRGYAPNAEQAPSGSMPAKRHARSPELSTLATRRLGCWPRAKRQKPSRTPIGRET
jgi:hypothetical protein